METKALILIIFILVCIIVIILMIRQNNKDKKTLFKKMPGDLPDPVDVKSEFDTTDNDK
jgi:preprotein translocase subunit YajC